MSHGTNEAYGYRLIFQEKSLAYTGDTDLCDGVYNVANDSNILIIELSNPDQDVPGHMSLEKLRTLRTKIGADVKIILNHVGPISVTLQEFDNIILPNDLDVLRF